MKKTRLYALILLFGAATLGTSSSCSRGYGCNNMVEEVRANKKSKPSKKSRGELFDRQTRRRMNQK